MPLARGTPPPSHWTRGLRSLCILPVDCRTHSALLLHPQVLLTFHPTVSFDQAENGPVFSRGPVFSYSYTVPNFHSFFPFSCGFKETPIWVSAMWAVPPTLVFLFPSPLVPIFCSQTHSLLPLRYPPTVTAKPVSTNHSICLLETPSGGIVMILTLPKFHCQNLSISLFFH